MNVFTHCLLCNSGNLHALKKAYAHAHLVRCSACGFVFSERIPSEKELADHYALYPRNTTLSPVTLKRYRELLLQFEPCRKTNRLLDIGCGDGHFLAVAKESGWEVYGTEFTPEAVAACQSKGIKMHNGTLASFEDANDFDVITSFEVMEHINNPVPEVKKIHSLLRSGGLFYFTTPNFNAMSRRWLGGKWAIIEYPEHLCYYTSATIHQLLSRNGFLKKSLRTSGFSLSAVKTSLGKATGERTTDETLRQSIEQKKHLRLAKSVVNFFLAATKTGDTLKGFYISC